MDAFSFFLGDVVAIYNTSGVKVASYAYDAWGNCTATGSMAPINPIRYRGYYWDSETGWYYLNARYYSPEWRRFISPDDTEYLNPKNVNGLNLYCYCNNDPINFVDPSGHFVLSSFLLGLGIAAAIGAGVGAASYAVGQTIDHLITGTCDWSWSNLLIEMVSGAVGGLAVYVLGPGAKLAWSAFVGGFASNATIMMMENAIYDSGHTVGDVIFSSFMVGGLSIISAGIMDKIRIPGLNSGRGSYSSISSQIYTKFYRGHIGRIKIRTFAKMFAADAYASMPGLFVDEIYSKTGIDDIILAYN